MSNSKPEMVFLKTSFAAEMKDRTKRFAVRVVKMVDTLPRKLSSDVMGRQVLRSATSVGANYRAACRARSKDEFRAKLGIVEEEADETLFWMEMLIESEVVKPKQLEPLMKEAEEILAIVVSSIKTSRVPPTASRPAVA